jgi:hypothetical protein
MRNYLTFMIGAALCSFLGKNRRWIIPLLRGVRGVLFYPLLNNTQQPGQSSCLWRSPEISKKNYIQQYVRVIGSAPVSSLLLSNYFIFFYSRNVLCQGKPKARPSARSGSTAILKISSSCLCKMQCHHDRQSNRLTFFALKVLKFSLCSQ